MNTCFDWEGKKAVFLGDSITEGCGVLDKQQIYLEEVKRQLHLREAVNYGIGGTRIAAQADDEGSAFSVRYTKMDDDADLVVVFGGTNDFGHGTAPIGSPNDEICTTYCGAWNVLLRGLIEKYPAAVIVMITPLHRDNETEVNRTTGFTLAEYVSLARAAAEEYSIPVLDLYRAGGIVPSIEANKQRYCPDGLHPNDEGHRLIARKLIAFLKTV